MVWLSLVDIGIRAIVSIVALFIFTRMLGKKQISQLNVFDYVIGISIGNIAAEMSVNPEVSYVEGLVGMAIYAFVSIGVSFLNMKSIHIRRFITGVPIILIEDGHLIEEAIRQVKFDVNELLQELRSGGYFDISEIEYAIMEANGKVSILPKSKYAPLTPNDMKIKTTYKGLTANLLIDGKVMQENLKHLEKDEKWLRTRLEKQGYKHPEELLLVTCDTDEKLSVYPKNHGKAQYRVLE